MVFESIDPLTYIIPSFISAVIAFVILGLNRFTKSSDTTITGTVRIEGLQVDLQNTKKDTEKQFDKLETSMHTRDLDLQVQFAKVNEKLDTISSNTRIQEYRLNQLENKTNKNGGVRSPI